MLSRIKYNLIYILIAVLTISFVSAAAAIAGNVTLSWGPPLTNEDGSALTDLAGYRIYYGTSSGDYMNSLDAGNEITYQITDLQERLTYYFSVTAYDTSGNESICSNEVSLYILQSPLDALPSGGQTCEGVCGIQSRNGCWCDDQCKLYGDCCPDFEPLCSVGTGLDRDGDGIEDARDNCLAIVNHDQADSDLNNIGDACDSGHDSNYVCSGTGADCPDYIDVYADLYECNLSTADLFVADLSFACLHGAVLTNANLHGASLMYADLSNADLRGAYLRFTDLSGANLNGADLTGAVLDGVIWWNTYCPDGTNSSDNKNTCAGHLF